MHKPVLVFRKVLFFVLTRPVHSVLPIHLFNLDSIRPFRGRPMSVALGLLALQGLQVQLVVPKGLRVSKASLAQQGLQEPLEQRDHEACKG
jgi:hypothetical protein